MPKTFNLSSYIVLSIVFALLFVRWLVVYYSPFPISVDEAQYWLWGQHFDFGYYSKPPLIAWIIGTSDFIFGHHSWAVRLPAAAFHTGTALVLGRMANLLYGARAGYLATLIWVFLPAVALGSFVFSTDTPLLFFWSLGLYYFVLWIKPTLNNEDKQGLWDNKLILISGIFLGMGMLAKYAAIYFLVSVLIALIIVAQVSIKNALKPIFIFLTGLLIFASPNLIWNAYNGFVSIGHIGENANLHAPDYDFSKLIEFWLGQVGILGPLLFILVISAVRASIAYRGLLVAFAIPALIIVSFQAFAKEANANWAAVSYPSLVVLVSGFLVQAGRGWQKFGVAAQLVNIFISLGFVFILFFESLGGLLPKRGSLNLLHGWDGVVQDIREVQKIHGVKTVLVQNRLSSALLNWYLYEDIPVEVFDVDGRPSNHYEIKYPFTAQSSSPVLAISFKKVPDLPDFFEWSDLASSKTDANKPKTFSKTYIGAYPERRVYYFIGYLPEDK